MEEDTHVCDVVLSDLLKVIGGNFMRRRFATLS